MAVYDLSHRIETGITTYPGDPDVSVSAHATHAVDGFRVSSVAMGSHSGTHVDAPYHTEGGGRTIDTFDIEKFVLETRVVPLETEPREPITVPDLPGARSDSTGDSSTETECLLLHTGWDEYWNTDAYLDHPYLTSEAAKWCAERDYHVGIDALNVDPTPSSNSTGDEPSGFSAHHALLGADQLIIENLRGLDQVPKEFTLCAFPLALANADGAPVRAVAIV